MPKINYRENYEGLVKAVEQMNSTVDFNLSTLKRKLKPFCKCLGSGTNLIIMLKGRPEKFNFPCLSASVALNEFPNETLFVAYIKQPWNTKISDITFHFSNNKEFLQKIIKHELLIKHL